MGEYAPYVWSSYALALLALVWIGVSARLHWRRELQAAQRRLQMSEQQSSQQHGK